ncbi:3-isopropylmalate dehydratase small subunit [Bordetella flabilis]|uniref:3-isopropylmalate dehydratase small subunit n=1 Tax=Bordetella flabilis TaxID=463014 RepID=A0A193GK79_9BORD|nr:3-isopropylmalate dehydratase small subunit [Bordetella flabilis]ANN79669.1 3-isopropylmalate dehydratase small subunit [Bordetella flabilis]
MEAFQRLDAVALPVARANVDTDQIVPARYLQKPRTDDFGAYLFRDLRYAKDGTENADFILNQPPYRPARIVVAQRNFGCGSSREHAVWALYDYGVRAVIAPSFGDIFFSNALKNGLLPIVLPDAVVAGILQALQARPGARIVVDLAGQSVTAPDGATHGFEVDAFSKQCLLQGMDELDYTLTLTDRIAAFERQHDAVAG